MFKKTLIAAAVAAVSATAVADVTISGKAEQGFADYDTGTKGWSGYTDYEIHFKASEDLGNGLTAFAQITLDADSTDADTDAAHTHSVLGGSNAETATGSSTAASRTATDNSDMKLGLTGGFGTVVVGRMEDFTEGVMAATMSTLGTNKGELAGNAGRLDGAIAYVSPTVSGFHVGVAGFTAATESDNLDATDIIAVYENGPVKVMVSQESMGTTTADALGIAEKTTSLYAKYSAGDLSVSALRMSHDNIDGDAAADDDDTMYRLDYTMGANKITLQHANNEIAGAADADTNIVELSHAFSKRTLVYVGATDSDTADDENVYVGLQHAF